MRINLDHYAATPLLPEARVAMEPFFSQQFGSPTSLHQDGLAARDALGRARAQMAALINARSPEEIIFTSSGTEAINLAIKGSYFANSARGQHIICSVAEHPAVLKSLDFLQTLGASVTKIPVDSVGRLDPELVRSALRQDTILVCIHHANHDLGTLQPVAEIGQVVGEHGALFFVDAGASTGWLPVDVFAWNASLVSFSAHRFYGPKGVGILYRNRRARIQPLIHGGDQEEGRRAGLENVPAIVGAGVAAEHALQEIGQRAAHVSRLQHICWSGLSRKVEYLRLNGPEPGPERHPWNLNLSVEFVEGEGLALMLDVRGVAVASGAACVTKSLRIPPSLQAIGLDESLAKGNLIITFGKENTEAEISQVVELFARTVFELREMSPAWEDFKKGLLDSVISPRRRSETPC